MIIKVSYSRTYNLGNFNSLRLEAGTEYSFEPTEDEAGTEYDQIRRVYEATFEECKTIVEAQRAKETS